MFMRLYPQGILKGLSAIAVLSILIVVGSRKLIYFDAALVPYLIATLFAVFGSAYRYSVWLSRPPTRTLWKRSLNLMLSGYFLSNSGLVIKKFFENMVLQKFIGQRSTYRWVMHFLLAWGCVLGFAVTFPLVFGWLHFAHPLNDAYMYQLYAFGFPVMIFDPYGIIGFLFFNSLNFCSVMIIVGTVMAFARRLVHAGEITTQTFAHDILPLLILFSVAISGLFLTFSTHYLGGQHYRILSTVHCFTVVSFLVYLPFGKFFHISQRSAQMGAELYIHEKEQGELAVCPKTGEKFTSQVQKDDVKSVLRELGFKFEKEDEEFSVQDLSPQARRQLLMTTQHKHLNGKFDITRE
jgi:nitrate reductase gamma subunit